MARKDEVLMAWIESHQDIGQHPKTYALSTALNVDLPTAVGLLHLLWHFTLKFAWRDGDLSKFHPNAISQSIGWQRDPKALIDGLQSTGWLDGMIVHDWLDYAGKIVHDRVYNEQRRNTPLNAANPRKTSATVPDLTVPNQPNQQICADAQFDFEQIWVKYPKRLGRKAAMRHFRASVKSQDDWQAINMALKNYIAYINKKPVEEPFIQNGSTWFNNWRDWITIGGTNGATSSEGVFKYTAIAREARKAQGLREITSPREILDGLRNLSGVRPKTREANGAGSSDDGSSSTPLAKDHLAKEPTLRGNNP